MATPLRVLLIEDSSEDAELLEIELSRAGYASSLTRVETAEDLRQRLREAPWDVIISDFALPRFSGLKALEEVNAAGLDVPFILLSGVAGEEVGVDAMVRGAHDYVMKDHMARLIPAIDREMREAELRRAKREGDARFRALFETMSQGVIYQDAEGRITSANRAAELVLGVPLAGMLGRTGPEICLQATREDGHPLGPDEYPAVVALRTGEPVVNMVMGMRPPGADRPKWIVVDAIPQFSPGRTTPFEVYCTLTDITERKRAEEERTALETQLLQSQKLESIGRLAGGVAHDFNNLLSPILGYADMMLSELPPADPRAEDLAQILQAAEKARDLTRQLLAFGRKQLLEMRLVNLGEVVRGLEKLLSRTLHEDIQLEIRLPDRLGTIRADVGQIEQVLMNLAVNAQDAMPGGGVITIALDDVDLDGDVATHPDAEAGAYVRLSFSDTGTGMAPDIRERVFEPFFTTKPHGKGTGLGLATVYGIVTQHGGNIRVSSEPGQGTTFRIYLPRIDAPAEGRAAAPSAGPAAHGSETIMVVEDDPGVREFVRRALRQHGYRVIVATTASECLALAADASTPWHLLLTDVVIPDLNGRLLYERLRPARPGLKVLYMSGYTTEVIATRGVLDKGVNFIQKPFSVAALGQKVRKVLDR